MGWNEGDCRGDDMAEGDKMATCACYVIFIASSIVVRKRVGSLD